MRKKFLAIFALAVGISMLTLLVRWRVDACKNFVGGYSVGVCLNNPYGRGFPIPIPVEDMGYSDGYRQTQFIFFSINVLFYFLTISLAYFVYSKLARKVKR